METAKAVCSWVCRYHFCTTTQTRQGNIGIAISLLRYIEKTAVTLFFKKNLFCYVFKQLVMLLPLRKRYFLRCVEGEE